VSLSNKGFEVLMVLIRDRHRVVEKEELLNRVWPDTVVEENNLTVAVSALRKALGEELNDRHYVVTIPGQGYRFAAEARLVAQRDDESAKLHELREGKDRGGRLWLLVATGVASLTLIGILAYWQSVPPTPTVLNYTQITNDGADKTTVLTIGSIPPPMVTDGSHLFFTELRANGAIAQVSVMGGATALISTPFANAAVNGLSPSGTDLLLYTWRANELLTPLWVVPVLGGSPRRIGETTQDATWLGDGRIVYASGHDLYISKGDGNRLTRVASHVPGRHSATLYGARS
jgi:hypothetical protein